MKSIRKQLGVSLIEVLVTAVILGVGLLGVAALQLTSINSNQEGQFRTQASAVAEDLQSRIRGSRMALYESNLDSSVFVKNMITAYSDAPYTCGSAPAKKCVSSSDCSPAEVVTYDKWEMCELAKTELPEGEVYVRSVAGSVHAQIAVAWTPTAAREDLGQKTIVNSACTSVGVSASKDCVILQVIP